MKCRVCETGFENETYTCPNCGYLNAVVFNSYIDDGSAAWRKAILSKLTDFSVTVLSCKWNSQKNAIDTKTSPAVLFTKGTTGKDLYQKRLTSSAWIAQYEEDKKVALEINYKFAGDPRKVKAVLTPTHGEVWHVGLQLDEHLQLVAYLGETASKSVPLKLS